jgi:hypothetical protein
VNSQAATMAVAVAEEHAKMAAEVRGHLESI